MGGVGTMAVDRSSSCQRNEMLMSCRVQISGRKWDYSGEELTVFKGSKDRPTLAGSTDFFCIITVITEDAQKEQARLFLGLVKGWISTE